MKISQDEIKKIANLARLKLSSKEIEKYSKQLSTILDYVSKLNELKLDEKIINNYSDYLFNIMTEDEVENKHERENLLKNTPEQKDGYIKVKSIL